MPTSGHHDLRDQLRQAREALLQRLEEEPDRWWAVAELRDEVQNGWVSTVISAAIQDLLRDGVLETNERLHIHLSR